MAAGKPMKGGAAYLVGLEYGPIKIGVTSQPPYRRSRAARRSFYRDYWDYRDYEAELYGSWPHDYAYMVEKLAHMYLMDHHITGEWFDVSIYKARRAVAKVIRLLDTGWKNKVTKDNWFRRHGLKRKYIIECFGMDAEQVMKKYNGLVRLDWSLPKEEKQNKLRETYRARVKRKANAER